MTEGYQGSMLKAAIWTVLGSVRQKLRLFWAGMLIPWERSWRLIARYDLDRTRIPRAIVDMATLIFWLGWALLGLGVPGTIVDAMWGFTLFLLGYGLGLAFGEKVHE